jgi:hypothetical protein
LRRRVFLNSTGAPHPTLRGSPRGSHGGACRAPACERLNSSTALRQADMARLCVNLLVAAALAASAGVMADDSARTPAQTLAARSASDFVYKAPVKAAVRVCAEAARVIIRPRACTAHAGRSCSGPPRRPPTPACRSRACWSSGRRWTARCGSAHAAPQRPGRPVPSACAAAGAPGHQPDLLQAGRVRAAAPARPPVCGRPAVRDQRCVPRPPRAAWPCGRAALTARARACGQVPTSRSAL